MKIAEIPHNDAERLKLIRDLGILDTQVEEDYEIITYIASVVCKMPVVLITLVDRDREWFKSHHGVDAKELPREYAFCSHTILDNKTLEVPDADKDDRFKPEFRLTL